MKKIRTYLAEIFGTFVLTFIGTATAVIFGGGAGGIASIVGISLAFGLTIVAIYYTIGHISGGHLNPAVTLAMFTDGRIKLLDAIIYIISQVIGALLGSGVLALILTRIPTASIETLGLGQNGFNSASAVGLSTSGALIVEVVLTFIFVFVVLASTAKEENAKTGGFIIGGALTMVHLVGVALTGTSVNPARSLAPAVILALFKQTTAISQVWVFIVAPLIGALCASIAWKVFKTEK